MSLKINRENLSVSEKIYDGSQEQSVELDYILPDYYHDIFKMIHTVNVSKDAAGKYWVHNCYKRRATTYMSDGPYEDLWSAIHNKESGERAVLCVMGIRKNSCIGEEKRV